MTLKSNVIDLDIVEEVRSSFLEYAMSVIASRALPDIRDGLKPVHRRVLFALSELGITPDKPHKKSARIVGEVIGKYHPHGDSAVYGTMVRMAQPFSLRYPFVDGHGNFGSIDGDSAAAMRYTEVRMSPLALEMMKDMNKDTIDMVPNYDGEEHEPVVLPARLPNLLVNGVQGIAVGMATNMFPHNLNEVKGAIFHAIDSNEEYTVDDLLRYISGPDFPTAAIVTNGDALESIYKSGTGNVIIEARWTTEELKGGKTNIVLTELPYMCNKASLITKIAELVREKKVEGITDLRDESDKAGIRVVIELKRDAHVNVIVEQLMRSTSMRTTFSSKFLVLDKGRPMVVDLKHLVQAYLDHQAEVVTRRTHFNLANVRARIHILEGLLSAQQNVDDVIQRIKGSANTDAAKTNLKSAYGYSDEQAQAIVDLRLARLTGMEKDKLVQEMTDKRNLEQTYTHILSSRQNVLAVIREELDEFCNRYGDARRTEITTKKKTSTEEEILETIPDEKVLVSVTHGGYIKRSLESGIVKQKRGHKGRAMTKLQDEDFVTQIFNASTRDSVLLFTSAGMSYKLKIYEIPDRSKSSRGTQIGSLLEREMKDKIQAIVPITPEVDYVLLVTTKGYIKKISISDFDNITKTGLNAMNIREGDTIKTVLPLRKEEEVLLCTGEGNAIRFPEAWLDPMPRDSYGVLGIYLNIGDSVVDADILSPNTNKDKIVVVTADGFGKLVELSDYRLQRHGGRGIRTTHTENSKGALVGLKVVHSDDEIVIVTGGGEINRQPIEGITEYSRYAQGVRLIQLGGNSKVVTVSTIVSEDE